MVQMTDRASRELRRLLTEHFARPQQGVRLRLDRGGELRMTIDVPHAGDSVIRRDNVPVLIVEARLSLTLAQRVLDFPADAGAAGGFTLGWRAARLSTTSQPEV
jgi:Fe-S cluster assembly iron-binding protein IscA